MSGNHLSEKDVIDHVEGRVVSPEIDAHLERCAECRESVLASREVARLLAPDAERRTGDHPDDTLLVGYLSGALPEPRVLEIRCHLDGCPTCRARAASLRAPEMAAELSERQARLVHETKRMYETCAGRALHTTVYVAVREKLRDLVMHRIGEEQPAAVFFSAPSYSVGRTIRSFAALLTMKRRPRLSVPAEETLKGRDFRPRRAFRVPAQESPAAAHPIVLQAGEIDLAIDGAVKDAGPFVRVALKYNQTSTPVRDVGLVLKTADRAPVTRRTGADGLASFPLPRGKSKLLVGTAPRWEVDLVFSTGPPEDSV
jgi:anti-sigma factor RsiW